MPSSKRARVVPTSVTKKNRKELVRRLVVSIHEAITSYSYVYVFSVQNMRNTFLKQVRTEFSDSRIFMGKTKVMVVALGTNSETEHVQGSSGLAKYVKGEVGLLVTNRTPDDVERSLGGNSGQLDYARAGATAEFEVRIPSGEVRTMYGVPGGEEDPVPMSIEPTLRKLGVPTRIVKGKVVLEEMPEGGMGRGDGGDDDEEGYLVCKEGVTLDSRQTSILKILGVRMSEFKMDLVAVFDKEAGTVKKVGGMDLDD